MSFLSHYIMGTYCQHDYHCWCNLDHLAEVVFVRFLYSKATLPTLSMVYSSKGSQSVQPKKSSAVPPQRQSICISHLEFFYGDLSLFPHLLIQSYVYISVDSRYLFYTLDYSLVLLFIKILTQIFSSISLWELFQLPLCLLNISLSLWIFLFVWMGNFIFEHFSTLLQDAPGSYCTSPLFQF